MGNAADPLVFFEKGQKTINAYWSRIWVQQRIVPSDRQNLGMILRDNGLDFYDEYKLLTMTNGRCSQDSYYLEPISEKDIPKEFVKRNQQKVEDVIPLPENQLLVFFRDGCVKKHDFGAAGEYRQAVCSGAPERKYISRR